MPTEEASSEDLHAKGVADLLPSDIVDALSEEQVATLRQLITEAKPWRKHPIDLRATWPLGSRRLFFTLVAGADRRNPERRKQDRMNHPIKTKSNLIFLGIAVVALYAIAGAIALLVASAVRGA